MRPILFHLGELGVPSFWLMAFSGLFLYFSFVGGYGLYGAGTAPDVGWFAYAPLTERTFARFLLPTPPNVKSVPVAAMVEITEAAVQMEDEQTGQRFHLPPINLTLQAQRDGGLFHRADDAAVRSGEGHVDVPLEAHRVHADRAVGGVVAIEVEHQP